MNISSSKHTSHITFPSACALWPSLAVCSQILYMEDVQLPQLTSPPSQRSQSRSNDYQGLPFRTGVGRAGSPSSRRGMKAVPGSVSALKHATGLTPNALQRLATNAYDAVHQSQVMSHRHHHHYHPRRAGAMFTGRESSRCGNSRKTLPDAQPQVCLSGSLTAALFAPLVRRSNCLQSQWQPR